MRDLASRLTVRAQITSDGLPLYIEAVDRAFGGNVDYARLIKNYGPDQTEETRYSPAKCTGVRTEVVRGNPNPDNISTSYVERQNLTMRMGMRRLTRLTNGFSKKIESHMAAIALHFMHYNFCRVHQSLRITPAMAAGVTDRVWDVADIVKLLESQAAAKAAEAKQEKIARFFAVEGSALRSKSTRYVK